MYENIKLKLNKKNLQSLSGKTYICCPTERLASLGIIGARFKALLKSLIHYSTNIVYRSHRPPTMYSYLTVVCKALAEVFILIWNFDIFSIIII